MKLLGILCVPFPAQHAQPGGSPASSRDGSKPDDISSTVCPPQSCHHYVTSCFPGSFLHHFCHPPPTPPIPHYLSVLTSAYKYALRGHGLRESPPARGQGSPGGQGALRGDRGAMVRTQREDRPTLAASGHSSHLEGQGTSLVLATASSWWGHGPRSPCCYRTLCPHGMATTSGHCITLGRPVPMARPPSLAAMSPCCGPTGWLQSQDSFNTALGQQHCMRGYNTPGDTGWSS